MPDLDPVDKYLVELQARLAREIELLEPNQRFAGDHIESDTGRTKPLVLQGGETFDKAALMQTRVSGDRLPASVSERRPEVAGAPFAATSLSLITHPRNPFVPTVHMNLRFFLVATEKPIWHFGGGFDLTPVYGFASDCVFWHRSARAAVESIYPGGYESMKQACDEYFRLPHRQHHRGIGGLFFDDWTTGGFDKGFALIRSLGDALLPAYLPIVNLRRCMPWDERHKRFQRLRRGRYAEFNLAFDRGTRYGLESGRRTESVLASLPPEVDWAYDWHPQPESREAQLETQFLVPRDWLAISK